MKRIYIDYYKCNCSHVELRKKDVLRYCKIHGAAKTGEDWTWFGSFKDLEENPGALMKFCSEKCAEVFRARRYRPKPAAEEPDKP